MPLIAEQRKKPHRYVLASGTTFATFVCVALVALLYSRFRHQLAVQKFSQLPSTADVLVANNRSQEAAETWENYARDNSNNKPSRAKAWENAGLIYMSTSRYSQGLSSFKSSLALSSLTYNLASELANAAMFTGNKVEAVQYFQNALGLMPHNQPNYQDKQRLIKKEIKQLQQLS